MNPSTAALLKSISDPHIAEFVSLWDELEHLIISVYRAKRVEPNEAARFSELVAVIRQKIGPLQGPLKPYWQATRVKGNLLEEDPFEFLLSLPGAETILDNWTAMQLLPAAREALNLYLLALIEKN